MNSPGTAEQPASRLPVANPKALQDLLRRVESATGADRELDRDLAEAFYPDLLGKERRAAANEGFSWRDPDFGLIRCEFYTASIDAALALVERVLAPEWDICLFSDHGDWFAHAERMGERGERIVKLGFCGAGVERERRCLTLLSALLRVLIAEAQASGLAAGSLGADAGQSPGRDHSPQHHQLLPDLPANEGMA